MIAELKKSPDFGERIGCVSPSVIVLHYTGMKTADEALERLCDSESEVSAHYFVDEGGRTLQLVDDDKRAWHAGISYWDGQSDINSHSIGIEIVNPGHEFGYCEFPEQQIDSVIELCKTIIEKHDISSANILGHSDIAPARKNDPGELFPWENIAAHGVGLWPSPVEMDYESAQGLLQNQDSFHEVLCSYGYDSQVDFKDVVRAFHQHFYPDKFNANNNPEEPDTESAARLMSLIRAVHMLKT